MDMYVVMKVYLTAKQWDFIPRHIFAVMSGENMRRNKQRSGYFNSYRFTSLYESWVRNNDTDLKKIDNTQWHSMLDVVVNYLTT